MDQPEEHEVELIRPSSEHGPDADESESTVSSQVKGVLGSSQPEFHCNRAVRIMGVQGESPLAWSVDGAFFAYVSGNKGIVVSTNVRTTDQGPNQPPKKVVTEAWEVVAVLEGHDEKVTTMHFSKYGNILVSCGIEGIFVWNFAKKELIYRVETSSTEDSHDSPVDSSCFIGDYVTFVTGARAGDVKFWDMLDNFSLLETIHDHKAPVLDLSAYEPHNLLASCGRDSTIMIYDVESMNKDMRKARLEDKSIVVTKAGTGIDGAHKGDVTALEWSHDGNFLFSGARDNTIKIWDIASRKEVRLISGHIGDINKVIALNKTQVLLSGSFDGILKCWKLAPLSHASASIIENEVPADQLLESILNEDSTLVEDLTSNGEKDMIISDTSVGEDIQNMEINRVFPFIAISSSTHDVRIMKISDLRNPEMIHEFLGHNKAVTGLQMIKKDAQLVSVSEDFLCALSDCATMQRIHSWQMETSISAVTVNPDESLMFLACNDYSVHIISLNANSRNCYKRIWKLEGHAGRVNTMDSCTNGSNTIIASAGQDFDIYLWSLKASQISLDDDIDPTNQNGPNGISPSSRTGAHNGQIHGLMFNEDGKLLASGGADHMLAVFKVSGSKKMSKFWSKKKAHSSLISSVAWGSGENQHLLASGSWDGTAKLWHVSRKRTISRELNVFRGHNAKVTAVRFSEGGGHLFTASSDCTIRQWSTSGDFSCLCIYSATRSEKGFRCLYVGRNTFASGSENGVVRIWPMKVEMYKEFFNEYDPDSNIGVVRGRTPIYMEEIGASMQSTADGEDDEDAMVMETE